MRICRVATVPFFILHHLRSQIDATVAAGNEVYVVCSPEEGSRQLDEMPGITFTAINIPRKISPAQDLMALVALYRYFRKFRFEIVHSVTPKAGLLCAVAALLARTPIRLHTFTGQPWVELSGPLRWAAKASDWLITHLNTRCYADSESQRAFLVSHGIAQPRQIRVLGSGSLSGVDLQRFDSNRLSGGAEATRTELSIPSGAKVITFIGRVTRDKGIAELIAAFSALPRQPQGVILILVGPAETKWDPLPEGVMHEIATNPNIRAVGYSQTPEKYLAVSHLLCLPSYREGFGNVVIEAAALGIPTVGTRIVGLSDTIIDGVTGILVPPRQVAPLTDALALLLNDDERRSLMGREACARAKSLFDATKINRLVLDEYRALSQNYLARGRVC